MIGSYWIEEIGFFYLFIFIMNSFVVGFCYIGIYKYVIEKFGQGENGVDWFFFLVVVEIFDGYLNDLCYFVVIFEYVVEGIWLVIFDLVFEGNIGGGIGMMCQGFKGGIGMSSRVVFVECGEDYIVVVFV